MQPVVDEVMREVLNEERVGSEENVPLLNRPFFEEENKKTTFNGDGAGTVESSSGTPSSRPGAALSRSRPKHGEVASIVPKSGNDVKARIQKFANKDYSIATKGKPIGAIIASLRKTLDLNPRGAYGSSYGIYKTPRGNVAFRLSGHTANGENFARDNADKNTSVVIEMFDWKGVETTTPYEEFVYPKDVFDKKNLCTEKIAKAIRDEVDGKVGVFYVDKTEAKTIANRLANEAFSIGRTEVQFLRRPQRTNVVHSLSDLGSPVKGVKPQIDTLQFKKWFGPSKIVDKEGKPMVVYHRTNSTFEAFDLSKARKSMDIQGFYFYADKDACEEYGTNVMPAYLSVKKPYIIDSAEKMNAIPWDQSEEGTGVRARVVAERILNSPDGLTGIPLTEAQRFRLEKHIELNPNCPYKNLLKRILCGFWYEQESFPYK
ncbi:MAG: hypothetical protein MJ109_02045 [Kiritimatiellae bacterium]|nr:hypothetical protein [Kiritimatiellia bacterium]